MYLDLNKISKKFNKGMKTLKCIHTCDSVPNMKHSLGKYQGWCSISTAIAHFSYRCTIIYCQTMPHNYKVKWAISRWTIVEQFKLYPAIWIASVKEVPLAIYWRPIKVGKIFASKVITLTLSEYYKSTTAKGT